MCVFFFEYIDSTHRVRVVFFDPGRQGPLEAAYRLRGYGAASAAATAEASEAKRRRIDNTLRLISSSDLALFEDQKSLDYLASIGFGLRGRQIRNQ